MERGSDNGLDAAETAGIIVAIASGATLLIIFLLLGVLAARFWLYRRSRRGYQTDTPASPQGNQVEPIVNTDDHPDGMPTQESKPAYTEEDIRMQKRRTRLGTRQFPRGDLLLLDYIADGEYGPVYKGEAYGLVVPNKSRAVTVKMLAAQATEATRIRFEQDIALLSSINHLNVVGMFAVCTEDSPECILMDSGTNLQTYIHEKKVSLVKKTQDEDIDAGLPEGAANKQLLEESLALLKIADEVCLGMAYLVSQHYVHKDLALRNCMIGYDGVAKVANFGIGPSLYPEAYYKVHGKDLPIRWMPPEAISSDQFTTASDLWAFGVLMWELFAYGERPYSDKSNEKVINFVAKDFGKLSRPERCMEDIYLVMATCWELEAQARPTFLILHEHIYDISGEIAEKLQHMQTE